MVVTPYPTYLKMQMAGPVEKPEHYHNAERIAIDELFENVYKNERILDVGCGIGLGMKYLESLGFENVYGIDLDSRKIRYANEKGGIQNIMLGDITYFDFTGLPHFDVIYSSHCIEHVYDADEVVARMKEITAANAIFLIILPYPNPNPSPAHWSTPTLGLDIDDEGATVIKWFEARGFELINVKQDDFREPEIWMTMRKA